MSKSAVSRVPRMEANRYTTMESELSGMIVSTLDLELSPDEIRPEDPLFGDGLGLDSIDALEISLEISKRYGVHIKAEDEQNEHIFASLRALAAHVEQLAQT